MHKINLNEIYTLSLAKSFAKTLIKKIYLTKDGKVSFAPDKYCIYDKKINFDEIGKFNRDSANEKPDNFTTQIDLNDGMIFHIQKYYVELIFRSLFDKQLDDDILPITNLAIANIIQQNNLPIISIDNPELTQMINDTDLTVKFESDDVKLPFDNFLLKLHYEDTVVELFINKVYSHLENNPISQTMIYAEGISVYQNGTYDKLSVPISGNVVAEVTNPESHTTEEIEYLKKVTNFVQKLFYYFTIEKTVEYIDKTISNLKSKLKPKTLKEQKYGVSIITLFKDIRYNYSQSNTDSEISKVAHMVRGHFRKQPYGKRDEPEYKIIWIQPYFTGSDMLNTNKKYRLKP